MAVSTYFSGYAFSFGGLDGLLLNSQALNDFRESLNLTVGVSVNVNAAVSLVFCTVTTVAMMEPNLNLMLQTLMCFKAEHLLVSHLTSLRLFSEHNDCK